MKIRMFYHSLVSDWNHGNAHFLRGVVTELIKRGHDVKVFEPKNGWSFENLLKNHGTQPIKSFIKYFPHLQINVYDPDNFNPEIMLKDADLVIVHEWNSPKIVSRIGKYKQLHKDFLLLFHDTHHRSVSAENEMKQYDLSNYDGVLAYGKIILERYLKKGWADQGWIWHEAADINIFKPPVKPARKEGDLVWIGNWGENERTEELEEFIIKPVRELGLKAKFYGVRYPVKAIEKLEDAGIEYGGWLPNYKAPEVFSKYRFTVHVPRSYYVQHLPGIPTIRPFEAMASGIPLICSPWTDSEGLFNQGKDYNMAYDKDEMKHLLLMMMRYPEKARLNILHARDTILKGHTCSHRVEELMQICNEAGLNTSVKQSGYKKIKRTLKTEQL